MLPDSRILRLPIRPLQSNPEHAVASLLVNHASLNVVADLNVFLADLIRCRWPDLEMLVGVPTLGLCIVGAVAERLGIGMSVLYSESPILILDLLLVLGCENTMDS
jgi:adenine/guanine phosphoribosyltransferase-like PRPP-binding protein